MKREQIYYRLPAGTVHSTGSTNGGAPVLPEGAKTITAAEFQQALDQSDKEAATRDAEVAEYLKGRAPKIAARRKAALDKYPELEGLI